jgi:MoaA/NifB/PqqE/SkfB family radical SAM enzyme
MGFLNLLTSRTKIVAGMAKYHYTGDSKPIFAHLLITNRCNLDCRYCFVEVNTIHKDDLDLEEWKQVVLDLKKRGCVAITLMGGEPLLFKGLDELVVFSKKLSISVDLITNGIGIEKQISTVKKVSSVMVSLDGDKEANDINRGKNSHKHVVEAVRILKENKIPVRINCMVARQNKNALPWLFEFAEEHKAPITFNLLSDFPHDAKDLEKDIMLSKDEIVEFYTKILDYKKKDPQKSRLILASVETLQRTIEYPLPYQEIVWRTPDDKMNSKNTCLFGQTWIHVNSNGDIYPCSQLWNQPDKFKPKSIRKDGIDAALENARKLDCKSCFCPAPGEWRRTFTPRGLLEGARVTFMQTLGS